MENYYERKINTWYPILVLKSTHEEKNFPRHYEYTYLLESIASNVVITSFLVPTTLVFKMFFFVGVPKLLLTVNPQSISSNKSEEIVNFFKLVVIMIPELYGIISIIMMRGR